MIWVSVDKLWEIAKHVDRTCGPGLLCPEEMLREGFSSTIPEGADEGRWADYETHVARIDHWAGQLAPFVGRERDIPSEWAIWIDQLGDSEKGLSDGFHRLTAAKRGGLKELRVAAGEQKWYG